MEAQATPMVRDEVPQTHFTTWHNPTGAEQSVVLHGPSGKFRFVLGPGQRRELDSVYDRAIQHIDCGREECRKGGWFCQKGHSGNIVGGLAPLLRRMGKDDKLDPVLDPAISEKKALEAQIAASALVAEGQEKALLLAAAKVAEQKRIESAQAESAEQARTDGAKAEAEEATQQPPVRRRGQA